MNPAILTAAAIILGAVFTAAWAARVASKTVVSLVAILALGPILAGLGTMVAAASGYALGSAIFLGLALAGWGLASVTALLRTLNAPAVSIADSLRGAGKLDLRGAGVVASPEAKPAAEAISSLVASLRDVLAKLARATDAAAHDARTIRDSADTLGAEGPRRADRISDAATSARALAETLDATARDLGALAVAAARGSSGANEVEASIEELAGTSEKLGALVEQIVTWTIESGASTRSVAIAVESLATASDETASAMAEMDASIRTVERNADETAKLSLQVSRDAETGADAVKETIAGIGRIREYSLEISGVVGSLGRRADAIGDVVTVINEVAEQTNLLALNAAIIAAQAGEHGKSFAVVADEIKDLAERTATSTKEIQELIRGVQEETANAVAVIERGRSRVTEGVELSGRAGGALSKILESSKRSTHMAAEIARATAEQGRGIKLVAGAVARNAQMIEGVREETSEGVKASERIVRTGEELKALAADVRSMVRHEGRSGRDVARNAGEIAAEARRIESGLKSKLADATTLTRALTEAAGDDAGDARLRSLEGAARDLDSHLQVVRGELDRFAM